MLFRKTLAATALFLSLLAVFPATAAEPLVTPDGKDYAWVQPAGWGIAPRLSIHGELAVRGLDAETQGNDFRWVSGSDDSGDIYSISGSRWGIGDTAALEAAGGLEAACQALLEESGAQVSGVEQLQLGGRGWLRIVASRRNEPGAERPYYSWYTYALLDGEGVVWLSVHFNDSLSEQSEQWLHVEVLGKAREVQSASE